MLLLMLPDECCHGRLLTYAKNKGNVPGIPVVIPITINRTLRSLLGKIFGTHYRTAVSHVDNSKLDKSHSKNRSASHN